MVCAPSTQGPGGLQNQRPSPDRGGPRIVGERVRGMDSGQAPLDGFGVAKSTVTGGSASALKAANSRQARTV